MVTGMLNVWNVVIPAFHGARAAVEFPPASEIWRTVFALEKAVTANEPGRTFVVTVGATTVEYCPAVVPADHFICQALVVVPVAAVYPTNE
jgi:hypothetical protein